MRSSKRRLASLSLTLAFGCSANSTEEVDAPTYHGQAKTIIDARCATCHRPDDIGPFPLTTHAEVMAFAGPVQASIERGTMPPWQPSNECNSYVEDIDLSAEEKQTLLAWLDAGAQPGEPAEGASAIQEVNEAFEADISLRLPEPYTPILEPDDYRCQLIPWPADTTRYVTGLRVRPEQRAIVHHVIVFVVGPDQVEDFRAFDAAEEGPGYTCYGGPRANSEGGGLLGNIDPAELIAALNSMDLTIADLQAGNLTTEQFLELSSQLGGGMGVGGFTSIGSWVPGVPAAPFPEGTGIRVEPGSMLVAQIHYNTLSANPVPDQSVIEIATTDAVEREATLLAAVDLGWVTNGLVGEPMTIPAGQSDVRHSTTIDFDSAFVSRSKEVLGLQEDAPLVLHTVGHHMHELGKKQRTEVQHPDGSTSCILDIPDWDFSWQGRYTMNSPMTFSSGDKIWMGCTWDNSAANQPIVDGEARQPTNVSWGEGTSDEMCLGSFYVTAQ